MFDETQARLIAVAEAGKMTLGPARELRDGWFFGNVSAYIGSAGIIVHKQTGLLYTLGSAINPERVFELYALGFQASRYDITIVHIADRSATSMVVGNLNLPVIEDSFEHGTHRKIPRRMRFNEIENRLDTLPCTFTNVTMYFCAERLEEARRYGWFEFILSNPQSG